VLARTGSCTFSTTALGRGRVDQSILFDRHDLATQMGTGIATYARSLAVAARASGYGADALISGNIQIDPRNPILSEVRLFDSKNKPLPPIGHPGILHGILRAPFGLRPVLLTRTGMVLDRQPSIATFDRTWVGRHLFVAAQAYYRVYGRRARVSLANPPALFHATQPLPLQVKDCPNIVTIHDLVPLRLPYFTLDKQTVRLQSSVGVMSQCRPYRHCIRAFSTRNYALL